MRRCTTGDWAFLFFSVGWKFPIGIPIERVLLSPSRHIAVADQCLARMPPTVQACLERIGVLTDRLESCADLNEEWAYIKKKYFRAALKNHPDKGGDAAAFRRVQSAFDALRSLYDAADPTFFFSTSASKSTADARVETPIDVPSWEYYAEAAQEVVPKYRVERARSSRSRCRAQGTARRCSDDDYIEKEALRVGWLDSEAGTYGGWVHLRCWRVPNRVWLGLQRCRPGPTSDQLDRLSVAAALRSMGAVLLSGISELDAADMKEFSHYCSLKANWARRVALKPLSAPAASAGAVSAPGKPAGAGSAPAGSGASASSSKALVPSAGGAAPSSALAASRTFVIPRPGRDGRPNSLAGKTVVLSGIFPEVGGGTGLSLGKDKVTRMVESFGGRVTSAVSGKTDVLLVGKEPGYAKVSQAQARGCSLLSLEDVRRGLVSGSLDEVSRLRRRTPVEIEDFSSGYRGNGRGRGIGHKGSGALGSGYARRGSSSLSPYEMRFGKGGPASRATHGATPTTAAVSKTTSKTHPSSSQLVAAKPATAPAAAAAPVKAALQYTAAPLETIEISQLKPTRFLLPPAVLPYRDEEGRVSLHLLRDSVARVDAKEVVAPEAVEQTLRKWLRHAEKEVAKGGHEWRRDDEEGVWTGPDGEVRPIVVDAGGETDEDPDDGSEPGGEEEEEEEPREAAGSGGGEAPKRKAGEVVGEVHEARKEQRSDGILV